VRVVEAAARLYRAQDCDSLIAVGGGSAMDTAKATNIVVSEGGDLLALQGVDRIAARLAPCVAIPTTAGTGSEVTNVAVIYNEQTQSKMAFLSAKLYPNVAILDPVMTRTLPPRLTAATGMDALTHACEAYYCIQKNPVSDAFSAAAIALIRDNLLTAVRDGGDEKARLAMANAALLAGIAFSNSMVGMVHALSHACGAIAHVPHGVANAILLPFGMEYNAVRVPAPLAALARMLGDTQTAGSDEASARRAPARIRALTAELSSLCGLPTTLSAAGVKREHLEQIARTALDDGSLTYNPEELTYEEALAVLNAAF
jgi:alcohol dehydrogenase